MDMKVCITALILAALSISGCLDNRTDTQKTNDAVKRLDMPACDRIEGPGYKEDCYRGIILAKNDSAVCKEIKDVNITDMCYAIISTQKNDITLCDKSSDLVNRDLCYTGYAAHAKDPSICERIVSKYDMGHEEPMDLKDGCYFDVAERTDDETLCEKVISQEWRDTCYYAMMMSSENPSIAICAKMSQDKVDACIYRVAEKKKDPAICKNITDADLGYSCEGGLKNDPAICEKISNSTSRDRCVCEIALSTDNKSLCYKIGEELKTSCLRGTGC